MRNLQLFKYNYNNKIYFSIVILLSMYFLKCLIEDVQGIKNVYDFMMRSTDLLTLSYSIIPTFSILIATSLSMGKVQDYFIFRFKCRITYYHKIISYIGLITTTFIFTLSGILLGLSFFSLSFKNQWSQYAIEHFVYHKVFLENFSPLHYVIISMLLLWLLLFLLGITFYIFILLTKNIIFSLVIILLIDILNVAVTIGKFDFLYPYFFTNNVNIMQYIYMTNAKLNNFPYSIFIYWIILIIIIYLFGRLLINKVDLNLKRGKET